MRRLFERVSSSTGTAYYQALARGVAECLEVRIGMVGYLVPGNSGTMRILAGWRDDEPTPGFDYTLPGTPCARVLDQGFYHLPERAAELFPGDPRLVELSIESYLGLRVQTRDGGPTGIVLALHDQPTAQVSDELGVLLDVFAQRVGVELEHEASRAALAASAAQYRRIVETCVEGVWEVDKIGNTTFANAPMAEMLGYTAAEMQGLPMYTFMDTTSQREASLNLARRREGVSERHEFKLRHRSGADVWTVMSTAPILDAAGAYNGAQAIVTDLTERRRLEARVLQAQKLESLGVLAGGIAHDFNNMLVGILGNVDFALQETPPASQSRQALTDIRDAGLRLTELTRQLLAYSGRGRSVAQRIDLNRLVEDIVQLLGAVISKKAQLRFDLASSGVEVEVDATQIRQVLMNLVTNASDALQATPGLITIETRRVEVDRAYLDFACPNPPITEGSYVILEIADTGGGMDSATREKIFDPFFSTKFAGRGLGLAATLGILRSHNGAISVQSDLGYGTRFTVFLPAASPMLRAGVISSGTSSEPASAVVLVVDDDDAVRKLAVRLLKQAGFEVLQARHGHEAVATIDAEATRLSVVLLDLTMPGLSGEEVLEHIQRKAPGLRVVLTSGFDENDTASRFVAAGQARFLAKPWRAADLVDAISAALK
jgi:PAS domain S-box-containing protein